MARRSRDLCQLARPGVWASALSGALGCGGVSEEVAHRSEGTPGPAGSASVAAPPATVTSDVAPEPERFGEADDDGVFLDPGCPEATERVNFAECDPLQPDVGCGFGQGCLPFVEYPDSPCEPEIFGARCEWVGSGVQGAPCDAQGCAAGFLCIATGQGTQCAQVCALTVDSGCPLGLVCGSIDVEGIGTCF